MAAAVQSGCQKKRKTTKTNSTPTNEYSDIRVQPYHLHAQKPIQHTTGKGGGQKAQGPFNCSRHL